VKGEDEKQKQLTRAYARTREASEKKFFIGKQMVR
jgi:hypothetical protein